MRGVSLDECVQQGRIFTRPADKDVYLPSCSMTDTPSLLDPKEIQPCCTHTSACRADSRSDVPIAAEPLCVRAAITARRRGDGVVSSFLLAVTPATMPPPPTPTCPRLACVYLS